MVHLIRSHYRSLAALLALVNLTLLLALAVQTSTAQDDDVDPDARDAAEAGMLDGEENLAAGRYSRAIRNFKKVLREGPDGGISAREQAKARVLLAHCERMTGDYEKGSGRSDGALEVLLEAWPGGLADVDASDPTRFIGVALADLYLYLGRFQEAEGVISRLLKAMPSDPEVVALAGMLAFETGKETVANEMFVRGVMYARAGGSRLNADDKWDASRAWEAVGLCYYMLDRINRQSQLANALECMKRAKRADPTNYSAQVRGAQYSLEGNQHAHARDTWLKPVLDDNPNHAPARAMEARTWFFQWASFQGATEAFAAYKTCRESLEALMIAAEAHINDQRYELAWEFVNKALAINNRSLEILTLKGLLHLYSGQMDEFHATEKAILERHATYSEFYAAVCEALVEQHRFEEAIEYGKKGLALDEKDWDIHKSMGFAYARWGNEAAAIEHLGKANQNDTLRNNLFTLNLLQVLRVLEKNYGTYDTADGRFRIRANKGEEKALLPLLERELDKAWDALTKKYGFEPKTPILFECFDRQDDFASRSIALPGIPALGVCFGQYITMLSPSLAQQEENPVQFSWARTLRHEMDHIFQIQLSKGRVPRWLAEGCSVYEERRARPEWDRELDEQMIRRYHRGQLLKLGDINNGFRDGNTIMYAYYQSSYMVEFIDKELGGYEKVVAMLKDFGEDKFLSDIVQTRLGLTIGQFDEKFRAFVEKHFIANTQFEPQFGPEDLARFKIQYEDDPEDPELRAKLGAAYLHNGFPLDARLHTGIALRLDPFNRLAIITMGRLLYIQGMAEQSNDIVQQARDYYEKALGMGVEDFQVYSDMAQLMGIEGDAEGAKEFLNMAKEAFPRYVGENNPYQLLAQLYQAEGNNDAALKEMEAFARIVELDIQTRQQLAQFYGARGDRAKAMQYLQEIENVVPLQPQLQQQLAQMLTQAGRWAEAACAWEVILGIPDAGAMHNQARRQLMEALFQSKQYDKGLAIIEVQLKLAPNDSYWKQQQQRFQAAKGE